MKLSVSRGRPRLLAAVAAAVLGTFVTCSAQAELIDHFSRPVPPATLVDLDGSSDSSTYGGLVGDIQATRSTTLTRTGGSPFASTSAVIGFGGSQLAVSNSSTVTSTLSLDYTGFGNVLDMSTQFVDLLFKSFNANSGVMGVTVTAEDGSANTSSASASMSVDGAQTLRFNPWDFSGSANLADISGLLFEFTVADAQAFTLESISTTAVPEPSTFAMLGLALVGVGRRVRRRKNA